MVVEVWDELNEPLGFRAGALAAPRADQARASGRVVAAAVAVALAIGLFALARRDAPLAGEPFAVAKVEVLPSPPKPEAAEVSAGPPKAVAPPIASAAQVEADSGVKVTRASSAAAPKGLIIDVTRALAARAALAQPNP